MYDLFKCVNVKKSLNNYTGFLQYVEIKFQDTYFASTEDFCALQEYDQRLHDLLIVLPTHAFLKSLKSNFL